MAVIHLLAAEILQWPALAVVMAAVGIVPEDCLGDAPRDGSGAWGKRGSARPKRGNKEN
jgi:hypothetical protein